jgi:hypothetical protein
LTDRARRKKILLGPCILKLGTNSFNRHRVSRTRRTSMGVRIVVRDLEPIVLALRRFKQQLK